MAQFGEKDWFRKIGEDGVSSFAIEQEQFCSLPRMELCEANVGQDRHSVMLGNGRIGKVCVALRGKL